MTLVLRACILGQAKRYLQEFASFGRAVTCFTHNGHNFKKFAPVLQMRHSSTNSDRKLDDATLVYEGPLTMQIRHLKLFSFLTSFGGLIFQPIIYMKAAEEDNMLVLVGVSTIIAFFAVGTPLLLHALAKRYVTDMYYYPKEDKYLAKTYTLFLRRKEIEFTANDVIVPDVAGMFTCCNIKGVPLFFDEKSFTDVSHYFNIMGHYKPIDFKLGTNVDEIKVVKEDYNKLQVENKQ